MAAAVSAAYAFGVEVAETLALGLDNVDDKPVTHSIGADTSTLNASSTPAATKQFSDTIALTAGAATLDLKSLAGPAGTTVNFDGLKVQLVKLKCPSTNSGGITVNAKDDVTGYNLFGTDNAAVTEKVEVMPGGVVMLYHDDELEDVDATHKDITFAGTGTDGIQVMLTAG